MEADKIIEDAKTELDAVCISDGFDEFLVKFSSRTEAVLALKGRVKGTTDYVNRLSSEILGRIDNFSVENV